MLSQRLLNKNWRRGFASGVTSYTTIRLERITQLSFCLSLTICTIVVLGNIKNSTFKFFCNAWHVAGSSESIFFLYVCTLANDASAVAVFNY